MLGTALGVAALLETENRPIASVSVNLREAVDVFTFIANGILVVICGLELLLLFLGKCTPIPVSGKDQYEKMLQDERSNSADSREYREGDHDFGASNAFYEMELIGDDGQGEQDDPRARRGKGRHRGQARQEYSPPNPLNYESPARRGQGRSRRRASLDDDDEYPRRLRLSDNQGERKHRKAESAVARGWPAAGGALAGYSPGKAPAPRRRRGGSRYVDDFDEDEDDDDSYNVDVADPFAELSNIHSDDASAHSGGTITPPESTDEEAKIAGRRLLMPPAAVRRSPSTGLGSSGSKPHDEKKHGARMMTLLQPVDFSAGREEFGREKEEDVENDSDLSGDVFRNLRRGHRLDKKYGYNPTVLSRKRSASRGRHRDDEESEESEESPRVRFQF